MTNWLLDLPIACMALVVFAGTYLMTAAILTVVTRLAVNERAKAFKALSPGMLPPLGILFALLMGFTAAQVWNDFERARVAVATEASSLRAVLLLASSLPAEQDTRLHTIIQEHIDNAVHEEWPAMARRQATLTALPSHLIEAVKTALAMTPADDGQRLAQKEILSALQSALDARRQRIIISQSTVSSIKWAGLLLQAICTLIAIAMVHSDNRLTAAIGLGLFSTGVAAAILLIAGYSRPFTGEISIGPDLLNQVMTTGH